MKRVICLIISVILFYASVFSAEKYKSAGEYVMPASIILPYKDISHRWYTINKMKSQTRKLADADKNIIKKYFYGAVRGEDTFLLINCYLRNVLEYYIPKKEITTPLKCRLEFYAKALQNSISKTKLPQNMILYKGIDEKEMNLIFREKGIFETVKAPVSQQSLIILQNKLLNSKYAEKGFLLTSYDKNTVKNSKFIFYIHAPKNLQAVMLDDLEKNSEKELLINMNTKWKITEITIFQNKSTKNDAYIINLKYLK